MKNAQKFTALLLSALLSAGVMTGCGGGNGGTNEPASTPGNREDEVNQQAHETDRDTSGTRTMTFGIQNYGGGGIDPAREINCAWNVSIELLYMGDASAKAMALQSGQLDLAENVTNISDLAGGPQFHRYHRQRRPHRPGAYEYGRGPAAVQQGPPAGSHDGFG